MYSIEDGKIKGLIIIIILVKIILIKEISLFI